MEAFLTSLSSFSNSLGSKLSGFESVFLKLSTRPNLPELVNLVLNLFQGQFKNLSVNRYARKR